MIVNRKNAQKTIDAVDAGRAQSMTVSDLREVASLARAFLAIAVGDDVVDTDAFIVRTTSAEPVGGAVQAEATRLGQLVDEYRKIVTELSKLTGADPANLVRTVQAMADETTRATRVANVASDRITQLSKLTGSNAENLVATIEAMQARNRERVETLARIAYVVRPDDNEGVVKAVERIARQRDEAGRERDEAAEAHLEARKQIANALGIEDFSSLGRLVEAVERQTEQLALLMAEPPEGCDHGEDDRPSVDAVTLTHERDAAQASIYRALLTIERHCAEAADEGGYDAVAKLANAVRLDFGV